MTTATASYNTGKFTVYAEVHARAVDLSEDAERGAEAAALWIAGQPEIDLIAAREEYRAAMEGELDGVDGSDTAYGKLIEKASGVAMRAIEAEWLAPSSAAELLVMIDIIPQ